MGLILDIVLVAIILLFLILGYRHGAVRTLIEFIGFFIALVAAAAVASWFASFLFETFVRNPLTEKISLVISDTVGQTASEQAAKIIEVLPQFIVKIGNLTTLSDDIALAAQSGAQVGAATIVDHIVGPVVVLFAQMLTTVLLFIIFLLIIRLIARGADFVARLPVLRELNGLLGMIIGAAKAALIISLLLLVIRAVTPPDQENGIFSAANIEQSTVFKWMYENNPLYELVQNKE